MDQNSKYFGFLSAELAKLLSQVVSVPNWNVFRRSSEVKVGLPASPSADTFYLYIISREEKSAEGGNFYFSNGDNVLQFREPVLMTTTFGLYAHGTSSETRLAVLDNLTSYFFDNRSMPPLLPEDYAPFPPLQKRLSLRKADLAALPEQVVAGEGRRPAGGEFHFRFQYSALYHSGNPLREMPKVQQRVITYGEHKPEEKRSVQ